MRVYGVDGVRSKGDGFYWVAHKVWFVCHGSSCSVNLLNIFTNTFTKDI